MRPLFLALLLGASAMPAMAQTTGSTADQPLAEGNAQGGAAVGSDAVTGADPAYIAELMKDFGYRAELTTDDQGDPKIKSAGGGANYSIYFYGCENNENCNSIQFSAGFDLTDGTTLEVVNEWNTNKRYGKVYLDNENDPYIEMDINLFGGGISPETLKDDLGLWDNLLADFQDHIDW